MFNLLLKSSEAATKKNREEHIQESTSIDARLFKPRLSFLSLSHFSTSYKPIYLYQYHQYIEKKTSLRIMRDATKKTAECIFCLYCIGQMCTCVCFAYHLWSDIWAVMRKKREKKIIDELVNFSHFDCFESAFSEWENETFEQCT